MYAGVPAFPQPHQSITKIFIAIFSLLCIIKIVHLPGEHTAAGALLSGHRGGGVGDVAPKNFKTRQKQERHQPTGAVGDLPTTE